MAKYDSSEWKEVTRRLGIKGFPTMMLYVNGDEVEYRGEREVDDIVAWLKDKVGPPVKETDCSSI